MMPYKENETIEILNAFGTNYRKEVMPWMVGDKKETSTGERRKKKRVLKKVDLTDEKSVQSYYHAVISNVRKRKEKLTRE